jgi:hypothetical protein
MPPGLQLGVNQLLIYGNLETPAVRRDERNRCDFGLVTFEQISRQTDGAVGVVSNCTVLDADLMSHVVLLT